MCLCVSFSFVSQLVPASPCHHCFANPAANSALGFDPKNCTICLIAFNCSGLIVIKSCQARRRRSKKDEDFVFTNPDFLQMLLIYGVATDPSRIMNCSCGVPQCPTIRLPSFRRAIKILNVKEEKPVQ